MATDSSTAHTQRHIIGFIAHAGIFNVNVWRSWLQQVPTGHEVLTVVQVAVNMPQKQVDNIAAQGWSSVIRQKHQTAWGDATIVNAEQDLYKFAVTKYRPFCRLYLASGCCIPLCSPAWCFDTHPTKSLIFNCPIRTAALVALSPALTTRSNTPIPGSKLIASAMSKVLTQQHTEAIAVLPKAVSTYFPKGLQQVGYATPTGYSDDRLATAPDEFMIVSLLNNMGLLTANLVEYQLVKAYAFPADMLAKNCYDDSSPATFARFSSCLTRLPRDSHAVPPRWRTLPTVVKQLAKSQHDGAFLFYAKVYSDRFTGTSKKRFLKWIQSEWLQTSPLHNGKNYVHSHRLFVVEDAASAGPCDTCTHCGRFDHFGTWWHCKVCDTYFCPACPSLFCCRKTPGITGTTKESARKSKK